MPRSLCFEVSVKKDIGESGEFEIRQVSQPDFMEDQEKARLTVLVDLLEQVFPGHRTTKQMKSELEDFDS